MIRSFILAASFPEGKGTGIDYLFYLEQEEVVGDWWLAAGRGWGVRGASKWGAHTVRYLDIISHLFRASGVGEIDFGLFRDAIGRPRNRPSLEVRGAGVSEPPSLFLCCGKLTLYLLL